MSSSVLGELVRWQVRRCTRERLRSLRHSELCVLLGVAAERIHHPGALTVEQTKGKMADTTGTKLNTTTTKHAGLNYLDYSIVQLDTLLRRRVLLEWTVSALR